MKAHRHLLLLVLAAALSLGLAAPACESAQAATAVSATSTTTLLPAKLKLGPLTAKERTAALAKLATLKTRPWLSMAGYERDLFRHWRDPDANGCDAREDALIAYGKNVKTGDGCKVLSGSWRDPYGGLTYQNPRQLDVDHIVPLAAAWRAGGARWNDLQRYNFANSPTVLLPVYLSWNRQKGDKGPEAWRPPLKSFWPRYAALWVDVKAKFRLTVTAAERARLKTMLAPQG